MSEATHTPGPWHAHFPSWVPWEGAVCIGNDSGRDIAWTTADATIHTADAKLIAAAPDLLDVLTRFAQFPFAHQGIAEGPLAVMLGQARAAIAKAEGKS